MINEIKKVRSCSFCNRDETLVTYIFYSKKQNIDICNYCIMILAGMVKNSNVSFETYTPSELKRAICAKVYGQDEAVKEVSICLFKHIHNINHKDSSIKSNLLLIGDTGCGKTYILDVAAKLLGIAVLIVDCTVLTSTGYIGDDVESMLARVYKKNNSNITSAERGIIFLDEFDKLAARDTNHTKDIGGESVQQELLRIVEGTKIEILTDNKKPYLSKTITIDTSKMLFIAGGAFHGLEDKIKRANISRGNSFFKPSSKYSSETRDAIILRNCLVDYGIIPELSGRFSSISILRRLSKEDFRTILFSQESRIKQYIDMLTKYNIFVEIGEGVIDLIVDYAHDLNIGARGINYIVDRLFNDILFTVETPKIKRFFVIDVEFAEKSINSYGKIGYNEN